MPNTSMAFVDILICCGKVNMYIFLQFFIDNKWHTWIDYSKFHDLVSAYFCTFVITGRPSSLFVVLTVIFDILEILNLYE